MASTSSTSSGSGIDWNSLADALMSIEHKPVDLLTAQQEKITGKKALYAEIKNALDSVKTAAAAVAKPKSISLAKATSSATEYLTASAENSAATGTYKVTVHQLATATRVTSGFATALGISAKADTTQTLNSTASHLGSTFTDGTVTINGKQISIDADVDTMDSVIAKINADVAGVTASYDSATDMFKFSSASAITVGAVGDTSNFLELTGMTASPDSLNGVDHERVSVHRQGRIRTNEALDTQALSGTLSGTGTFSINGVSIDYDTSTDSLNSIISRINTKVSTVVASYDSQTDKLVLASRQNGSLDVARSDTSGTFLQAVGLLGNSGDSRAVSTLGQNSKVTVDGFNNGNPIYSTSNTVANAIPGVSLTLLQADQAKTVNVTVTRDTSDLKSKVNDLVSKYNAAMSLISSRLTEDPIANATSTTAQRVGLLKGDTMLATMKTSLTRIITESLTGLPSAANRLGALGITTSKTDYKTGQISFDQTKFDDAFASNYEQAYDVLFSDTDNDGTVDAGEGGAIPKMLDKLTQLVDTTLGTSTSGASLPKGDIPRRNATLDSEYNTLKKRIADMEARLELRDAAMRARFQAAESQINAYRNQASSLYSYG
ncbi:MAG: flagellar filament capping protein FliD [Armatimonadetes bacterium]|nr:flagellar filament capping protein FliD [Armatimonadota bacterium]